MAYFKINGVDFSHCVNELNVGTEANYTAQTNAAGNTVVDFINKKRIVEVGIIPLNDADLQTLSASIYGFTMTISFLDPNTKALTDIVCILPSTNIEYQTIQVGKVMSKAFTLQFIEL